jgi:hypothetical protein
VTKKFTDLQKLEQHWAIEQIVKNLADCAANGLITFGANLQSKIDKAIDASYSKNMHWEKPEFVLEAVGKELREIAKQIAEDSSYTPEGKLIQEATR